MTADRNIDIDGVPVPLTPLVLGTMTFGDTVDEATAHEVIEAAIAAGITGIDTANGYAKSTTESLISPMVKKHRDTIVLATKAGMPHADAGENSPLSAAGLRASIEGSLRRLDVDSIDLFYLHQPDRAASTAETLDTIAQLHAEGKIRALGISNFAAWQAVDLQTAAAAAGAPLPVIAQNVYSVLARRIEDEWLECASVHGIATMAYNPLAGGLLARRPSVEGTPDRFTGSVLAQMYSQRYLSDSVLAAVEAFAEVADEAGMPQAELALRWVAGAAGVDSLLLGASRVSQLESNLASIAKGPLPDDVLTAIDSATAAVRGSQPKYNR
ncbi:aryl-alcohol dehydrogenase-like predicted oxidoreductase [Brevibacterium sanguinis]|uniref:Aryl-alcohol dehydrogenase-like predicted oxidoreductase n=2 Tax=Brevibacterium TaxID=1696 RepID=A0A366IJD3_9MICO|nr:MULTISPECIES: aldo/keto reductase [Brevibacterium]RBP61994.1 aryl-alcohol dehydrogenase-like predicted oxidoreductase [Brevibacterium sanguinis]RBP70584.1 aryl-alcohol dehydrogenase-like predicted oxidoreductase [Brevibacterium celere]